MISYNAERSCVYLFCVMIAPTAIGPVIEQQTPFDFSHVPFPT